MRLRESGMDWCADVTYMDVGNGGAVWNERRPKAVWIGRS
jgi:hypothetical protein